MAKQKVEAAPKPQHIEEKAKERQRKTKFFLRDVGGKRDVVESASRPMPVITDGNPAFRVWGPFSSKEKAEVYASKLDALSKGA